jgi:murein DD-endopeptidase MepM/ murein hydrolase activator NlpD
VLALILIAAFTSFFLSKSFSFEADSSVPIRGLSLPSIGASPAAEPVLVSAPLPGTVRREQVGPALALLAEGGQSAITRSPSGAAAAAEVEAEAAGSSFEPYTLYSVQPGDSASAIAAAAGIDLQYLIWANADLRDEEFLTVGQLLVVPGGNGILHDVRGGETLSAIADRYGVTIDEIMAWPGNAIASVDALIEAQSIFVPNGSIPYSILPAEQPPAVEVPVAVTAPPVVADPGPASSIGLSWPALGPISSYYGPSHPLGIDIDLYNNVGAPIGAATEGTVTFVGGDPCCSYGLYVVIMSPTGIETLYAHFSGFTVGQGEYVVPGQTLGYSGCTGYCTGTHLHFEVIDNGVRVDPLAYLP